MTPPGRIAALVGPTASGKTALAVALRRDHGLPVEAINVDALQVYRRLEAGTARPTAAERAALPYHLVDVAEPTEAMDAARYLALADAALAEVAGRGAWPLLVGGTGLYLRAVLRGLAAVPPVPAALRQAMAEAWNERGSKALHAELSAADPVYAAATPPQNRQRVLRALEVWHASGRPFSSYHADHAALPDRYTCWIAVLAPDPATRTERIDARAEAMAGPLLAELAQLLAEGVPLTAPAMLALGYREAAAALESGTSTAEFAGILAQAHRQYAKKQATWFRGIQAQRRLPDASPESVALLATDMKAWFL